MFTTLRVGHSVNTPWQNDENLLRRNTTTTLLKGVVEGEQSTGEPGRTGKTAKQRNDQTIDRDRHESIKNKVRIFGGNENPNDWWSTGKSRFEEIVLDIPLTITVVQTNLTLTLPSNGRALRKKFPSAKVTRINKNKELQKFRIAKFLRCVRISHT